MSVTDDRDLRVRVQQALDGFLESRRALVLTVGEELAPLVDELAALLSGGKRMRPAFCFWGALGAGGEDTTELVHAAAALELLQACAIVHDDVMDGSDTRRGRPAAHRHFAEQHRAAGWTGDSQAFGDGAAILLGDLCLAWCDEMLRESGLPRLPEALRVLDVMRTEVMAGQVLDLVVQARGAATVPAALRVAHWKSAKYTVERPLHLGAALAGGSADLVATYSAYGQPLGEAFQLRDDVLGVFGDPSETGKPAGDDLREGKRTALVAMALEQASPAQLDALERLVGDPDLDADGVELLRGVLVDTGAVDRTEELIATRTQQALDALVGAPVEAEAARVLGALAVAATTRSA